MAGSHVPEIIPINLTDINDLRERTRVALKAGFVVVAAAGGLVFLRILAQLQSEFVAYAASMRSTLGFVEPPTGTADWYLIATASTLPLAIGGGVALTFLLSRTSLRRRVSALWKVRGIRGGEPAGVAFSRKRIRQNNRVAKTHAHCGSPADCRVCSDKTNYLSDLFELGHWDRRWEEIVAKEGKRNIRPSSLIPELYEEYATDAFEQIQKDVSTRALAITLAVGFNRNRILDALTVLAGTFEIQLFVLRELGKYPTLPLLWRITKNSIAALFVNLFLNREDIVSLHVAVKKVALGAQIGADLVQEIAHHLSDLDFDLDEFALSGVLDIVKNVTMVGMTVGSSGLHAISVFIDRFGNDLVQACLAGGIAWHHAGWLAADVLARDERHRERLRSQVTAYQCATGIANSAGEILRGQVQILRTALRSRRIEVRKRYLKF